jgi:hypothetical protein
MCINKLTWQKKVDNSTLQPILIFFSILLVSEIEVFITYNMHMQYLSFLLKLQVYWTNVAFIKYFCLVTVNNETGYKESWCSDTPWADTIPDSFFSSESLNSYFSMIDMSSQMLYQKRSKIIIAWTKQCGGEVKIHLRPSCLRSPVSCFTSFVIMENLSSWGLKDLACHLHQCQTSQRTLSATMRQGGLCRELSLAPGPTT